jgi:hypothetical protein
MEKIKYRETIFMKELEYQKLINDFGKNKIESILDTMEDYLLAHGKKYKDYYRAVRMWLRNDKAKETIKTDIRIAELHKKYKEWYENLRDPYLMNKGFLQLHNNYLECSKTKIKYKLSYEKLVEILINVYNVPNKLIGE